MTLLDLMPDYYQDIQEMNELLRAEDALFLILQNNFNRVKANRFIKTADEAGIAQFEAILAIVPGVDEDLEIRRSRVLSRWINISPYTHNALMQRLKSLQGNTDFQVTYDYANYQISVVTNLEFPGQVDELDFAMTEMIPANMALTSVNEIPMNAIGAEYVSAGFSTSLLIELTDAGEYEVSAEIDITGVTTVLSDIELFDLTESFDDTYQSETNATAVSANINLVEVYDLAE